MTNNQLFLALAGLQVTLLLSFFGFVYKYIDSKFESLGKDLDHRFDRQDLLLQLHEALHHPEK